MAYIETWSCDGKNWNKLNPDFELKVLWFGQHYNLIDIYENYRSEKNVNQIKEFVT